ncbi:MAG: hypothetical protein IJS45_06040 [Clostridia bacterium]|nr:hypothetical protein [Clostridia bacterium]
MRITSKNMKVLFLIFYAVYFTAVGVVIDWRSLSIFYLIFLIPLVALFLCNISSCRTFELSKSGCMVKFGFIKRHYTWDDFKTKIICDESGRGSLVETSEKIVLLSPKSNNSKRLLELFGVMQYSAFFHPFSFIYFYLIKSENYSDRIKFSFGIYPVEERTFLSLMSEFNITFEKRQNNKTGDGSMS